MGKSSHLYGGKKRTIEKRGEKMFNWIIGWFKFFTLFGVILNFFLIFGALFLEEDEDEKKRIIMIRMIQLVVFLVITVLLHRFF